MQGNPVAARSWLPNLQSAQNSRYLAVLAALAIAVFIALTGATSPAERAIRSLKDSINSKPASGQILLVEIDARSLQQLDSWPWPRSYHGRLVDQLVGAGAEQVVFDVDFSSRSTAEEDQAFADAIARSNGRVVLPTFRQVASSTAQAAELENLPIDVLREHAFLGSVNVHPDADGQVNSYPFGAITGGVPRPSLGALLAESSGPVTTVFDLDHSIEISTIPSYSFVDIVEGRFDPADFEGKRVIVGATAIEMGDRYATARFGVVPGVFLQALAGETLLAGMVLPHFGPAPLLMLAFILIAVCPAKVTGDARRRAALAAVLAVSIFSISLLGERFRFAHIDISPALLFVGVWLGAHALADVLQRLDRARHVDRETGLPNLAAWTAQKLAPGPACAVVADVANFEEILSTLNETEASGFVTAIADRLQLSCGGAPLHRAGRQQFCWQANAQDAAALELQLENAVQLFTAPILISTRTVRAKLCLGLVRGEGIDPASQLHKAALAARRAAELGQRWHWHDEHLAQDTDQTLFIVSEFEPALAAGELHVVYQPKFSIAKHRVAGAEALVRWKSPARGAISPAVFVPILEREGLVEPLTIFVLREAVSSLEDWSNRSFDVGVAVNVSAALLGNQAFVDKALEIIGAARFEHSLLTIELTETAVLSSPEQAAASLARFAALGVKLSIDDYGTGQSTLSYLKNFSAGEIKIDQSFIRTIAGSEENRIMVRSTIDMAHALGISVVAEGVEDQAALDILKQLGCDTIQGWHIGAPVTKAEFVARWCRAGGSEGIARAS